MTLALTWTESIAPASQIERYQVWRAEVAVDVQPPLEDFEMVFEIAVERDAFGAITNSAELYSYTDLTADPDNFFYFYFVKAIAVQGPSSRSAVTVPSGGGTPYGPVSLDANFVPAVDQSVDFVWNNPVGGTTLQFRVKRSVNGGASAVIATLGPSVFTYNDTDNVNRITNTYSYFVEAESTGGTVRTSNTRSFDLLTLPSAPVLTAVGSTEIDLDWTASVPDSELTIANYRVERSDDGGAFAVLATVSGVTLTYLDDDPTIDRTTTEYDYRVYAIDSVGQERVSNTVHLPIVSPQRVVFNASNAAWQVPAGVTTIDVLMVGGGGGGSRPLDGGAFGGYANGAGGGGGGVVVANGISVTPLETLNVTVGAGGSSQLESETSGGFSRVVRNAGGAVIAGPAGGGGRGPTGGGNADSGGASNGSGGGGAYDWLFDAPWNPANGNGTGGNGANAFASTDANLAAGGGGGGAGANGTAGASAVGGNGGNGVIPSASVIGGAWGTDIGESGYFGGGGGGGTASGTNAGSNGLGNGAANTGGGGSCPTLTGLPAGVDGRSGIVVIYYSG